MNLSGAVDLRRPPASEDSRWEVLREYQAQRGRCHLFERELLGHDRRGRPIWRVAGSARMYLVTPRPPFHIADGTAATAAALAEISPVPPIVFGANELEQGSRLEFSSFGRLTTAATPGTFTYGIYIGTGAIAAGQAAITSAAIAGIASQTNRTWRIEGNASIRTVGSGTAATIIGALEISNVSSNGTDLAPATAPATFAFDSTVANNVRLGYTPSLATASCTCHYFGIRLVN